MRLTRLLNAYTNERVLFAEEPLITHSSALRVPLSPLSSLSFILGSCLVVCGIAKEPVKAFFLGVIGRYYRGFSSFIYRTPPRHTTPMSGGGNNMNHPVEVARESPPLPAAFYKLY